MRKSNLVVILLSVVAGIVLLLASVSGQHPLIKDTDGDGIPDGWEDEHGLNPDDAADAKLDYNYNGWTNFQEYTNASDPWDKDTDKDGVSNYAECWALFGFFTDPFVSDTDGDEVSDLKEICTYINTSDETQMMEIYPNETNRASVMVNITNLSWTYPYKLDPTNSDVDGDGLSDGDEVLRTNKTNPNCVDSDYDGLSDGDEVHVYKTEPTKRDTDRDGLLDSEELFGTYGVITDPTKRDSDEDGLSDGEEIFGFGFAPIEPSEHALTYEEFQSGAYSGEYITLKAKVEKMRFNYNQTSYLVFLNPLESGGDAEKKKGVARVNSSWHYDFEHDMMYVDNRFGLALREGDTIVVVGKAGKFLGDTREIEVGSEGKMYLVLSPEEARERWLPSKGYVKIIYDSKVGSGTVTPSPTPSPAQTTNSSLTPSPSTSLSTPLSSSVNETNETASESGLKKEGKGILGSLIYVVIGIVIVIATLFLYTKFGGRIPIRKERKEGEGSKPVEASGMQKGTRKEWS